MARHLPSTDPLLYHGRTVGEETPEKLPTRMHESNPLHALRMAGLQRASQQRETPQVFNSREHSFRRSQHIFVKKGVGGRMCEREKALTGQSLRSSSAPRNRHRRMHGSGPARMGGGGARVSHRSVNRPSSRTGQVSLTRDESASGNRCLLCWEVGGKPTARNGELSAESKNACFVHPIDTFDGPQQHRQGEGNRPPSGVQRLASFSPTRRAIRPDANNTE